MSREITEVFTYIDGMLFWKNPEQPKYKGKRAGTGSTKYRKVFYKGKSYKEHRLIWELFHGPISSEMQIDHINGIPQDNRIENLRLATTSQNCMNQPARKTSKSGIKGISRHKATGKWVAQIRVKGTKGFYKLFDCLKQAAIETQQQRELLNKEFTH